MPHPAPTPEALLISSAHPPLHFPFPEGAIGRRNPKVSSLSSAVLLQGGGSPALFPQEARGLRRR